MSVTLRAGRNTFKVFDEDFSSSERGKSRGIQTILEIGKTTGKGVSSTGVGVRI